MNGLADRIDDLVAAEREAAADVSHRLRTPVAALRLDAERLPAGPHRDRLIEEVQALEHAVDDVIRSARSTAPRAADRPVDAVASTRARLAFWSLLAENQNRTMTIDIEDGFYLVAISATDLDAAIDALVGNVFAHTPEGTDLRVSFVQATAERPASLVVDDSGPGLVDSFLVARGASGAGSTGLGLDIARRTAEATGGRLIIGRSPSGGARVELVFGAGGGTSPERPLLVSRR